MSSPPVGRRIRLAVKRFIDVAVAVVAVILAAPVLLGVAIAVRLRLGRPVLFRQERPGLHGRTFVMIKFRTMRPTRPGEVWYQTDAQRVTTLGRFLRATSLDELPELFNVLRGDMSLVGPRPLLTEYLEYYSPEQHRRHTMRPGITGWAAVNGRNTLKFDHRLRLDTWYIDRWSLRLDLKIMGMTFLQVLRRDDVAVIEDIADVGYPLPGVPLTDSRTTTTGPPSSGTEPLIIDVRGGAPVAPPPMPNTLAADPSRVIAMPTDDEVEPTTA